MQQDGEKYTASCRDWIEVNTTYYTNVNGFRITLYL